jgi:excisionase family DNA binding protein
MSTAAGRPFRVTTIRSCSRSTRSTNSEKRSLTLRSESVAIVTIVPRLASLHSVPPRQTQITQYSISGCVICGYQCIVRAVRTETYDRLAEAESDQQLTTGEAASILNSSRQHVVDLCDRGDLSYTTIGRHRRIRRADIEAVRTRTQRMTRDQLRSRWLSHAIAGKLVADPMSVLSHARSNLERMRTTHARGQNVKWLDEWDLLLKGGVESILDALTSPSPRSRELRQNSPFAGVLNDLDRQQVLRAFSQVLHVR